MQSRESQEVDRSDGDLSSQETRNRTRTRLEAELIKALEIGPPAPMESEAWQELRHVIEQRHH